MEAQQNISAESIVVRFAGDSGDGMQLTGSQFTNTRALVGNDLATLPDYPAEIRAKMENGIKLAREDFVRWQKSLYEKGWIAPGWPKEYGGGGLTMIEQLIFLEEQRRAGAPSSHARVPVRSLRARRAPGLGAGAARRAGGQCRVLSGHAGQGVDGVCQGQPGFAFHQG